jgi:hypothetical protein
MKPLGFGSWLFSHLLVKMPTVLGLIEGANPNSGIGLILNY